MPVVYCYEEPGYWHIYSDDNEPGAIEYGAPTLLHVYAPNTQEWEARIRTAAAALNAIEQAAST